MEHMVDPLDRPVIATADDAILAKQATVAAGYYDDPFLEHLSAHATGVVSGTPDTRCGRSQGSALSGQLPSRTNPLTRHTAPHRSSPSPFILRKTGSASSHLPPTNCGMTRHQQPIIKRGTHARVCCIDRAISAFASLPHSSEQRQVVVLGAGKDTSYFRYQAGLLVSNDGVAAEHKIKWFEVDHSSVIHSKARTIQGSAALSSQATVTAAGTDAYMLSSISSSSTCHLLAHDLRLPPKLLIEKMSRHSFDPGAHTLFVLECVQMYLPEEASRALLQCLSQSCPNAVLVLYDPILGADPFGKVMEQHLLKAGVVTNESSLIRTRVLSEQLDKLVACGFDHAVGCDMWAAYETIVTAAQRRRANQCEFLDELEEWMLIMRHYCFVVCCRRDNDFGRELTKVGPSSPVGFVSNRCQRSRQER